MKPIKLYLCGLILFGTMFTGCEKGFDDLNTNKVDPVSLDPQFVMNKGIIVAFSLLVGCGAATAAYLLYTSKRDSSDNKDSNEIGELFEVDFLPTIVIISETGYKTYSGKNQIKKLLK